MEKKQTAVDYTEENLKKLFPSLLWTHVAIIFEQAKAMDKEQIINARQSGIDATINGKSISNIDYYNETFGGE